MTFPFADEVAACRAAQRSWSRLTVRERLRPIRKLRHLIVEHTDEICAAIEADIGRPAVEVVGTELLPAAAALKFLEREAARVLKPRRIGWRLRPTWLLGCRDIVHRRPWGVVGIIGTWNYPIYLNVGQIAQALVAGNGVLWKPSENAPRTADLTHRLFLDAGFPSALFARLPATREGGSQLAEAEVDHVVFTGSDRVGRVLAARLGERLIPSTLELSGCDAMFVLEDANLAMAAKAAWFGLVLNRGQTCIAVRRIFVHRSRAVAFADALRPFLDAAKPLPLVTSGQVDQAKRLIDDAEKKGATLLREGEAPAEPWLAARQEPRPPDSILPTILLDATANMAICREASFAPIACIIPFDTIDNAVSLAAQSPYGLSASIFTDDLNVAEQLAARIPSGSVVINDVIAATAHPATPFGGRGASGWGVTQGPEGLLAMTVPQVVTVRKGTFRPHLDETTSPDPATWDILHGLLRATHGRGFRDWIGGIRELIRGIRRKK